MLSEGLRLKIRSKFSIPILITIMSAQLLMPFIKVNASPILLAGSDWLSGNGVNVYLNDNGVWQCVELVNRLYETRGWIEAGDWSGNGNEKYAKAPNYLGRSAQGSISSLKPGDVISWDDGGWGHAAVVNKVTKNGDNTYSVETVNQNTSTVKLYHTWNTSTKKITGGLNGFWVIGVVHAPEDVTITPSETSVLDRSHIKIDFDGDGKTDVFRPHWSNNWYVSYGGTSEWKSINNSSYGLSGLAFGDFDGDGKTDVFRTDSTGWHVSYGGTTGWNRISTSSYGLSSLAL